jgi:hypothetical protein
VKSISQGSYQLGVLSKVLLRNEDGAIIVRNLLSPNFPVANKPQRLIKKENSHDRAFIHKFRGFTLEIYLIKTAFVFTVHSIAV